MDHLAVGLGWDAQKRIDLDAIALCLDRCATTCVMLSCGNGDGSFHVIENLKRNERECWPRDGIHAVTADLMKFLNPTFPFPALPPSNAARNLNRVDMSWYDNKMTGDGAIHYVIDNRMPIGGV